VVVVDSLVEVAEQVVSYREQMYLLLPETLLM
jgi:hypothetical protein